MKKTSKSILILVTLILIFITYLLHSELMIQSFLDYSKLFLKTLFPSSFLFFLLSSLLIDYGMVDLLSYLFPKNTSRYYILFISMISGFPSGAKYTVELFDKGFINKNEAENILLFSHFPNPLFVLGSVCQVIGDRNIALKILLSIIISNLIIFIFSKRSSSSFRKDTKIPNDFSKELSDVIIRTFRTILIIYGTSLFFYLISVIILQYFSLSTYYFVLISGLFDITKGIVATSVLEKVVIRSLFVLLFLSFGGISIHMQVKSILSDSIRYRYYFIGRVIGTILAFIIFLLLI